MSEAITIHQPASELGFSTGSQFDHIQRVAKMFSESQLVPTAFQRNMPNVTLALAMSQRIGCDPLMVMQNLNIIHGKPSFGASFMIATVNSCGRFTPLRFHFVGEEGKDNWGCYAMAKAKVDNFECRGVTVTMEMAKAEGWLTKSGSKWKTMPQLMMQYRAATFWTRAFAPEILMGFPTQEEVIDVDDPKPDAPAADPVTTEQPTTRRRNATKGVAAMKAAEPVAEAPKAEAAPASTPPANPAPSPESSSSSEAQTATTAEAAPASATEKAPTPPSVSEPTAPAQESLSSVDDMLPRCELVSSVERGAGVFEVTLKGDYNGIAFYQKTDATPALPSIGAVIDVELEDKPSRRSGAPLKVLKKFTVIA